jgi:hypothetical protein
MILSSSRTGCYFFPSVGKSNQKEPPLKDKKLKTEYVRLKISKLSRFHRDQTGKFFKRSLLLFFKRFFSLGGLTPAKLRARIRSSTKQVIGVNVGQNECGGRQNARPGVRFDKIFASFSSIGKGRASPA